MLTIFTKQCTDDYPCNLGQIIAPYGTSVAPFMTYLIVLLYLLPIVAPNIASYWSIRKYNFKSSVRVEVLWFLFTDEYPVF